MAYRIPAVTDSRLDAMLRSPSEYFANARDEVSKEIDREMAQERHQH
jgi:hypothetical protein